MECIKRLFIKLLCANSSVLLAYKKKKRFCGLHVHIMHLEFAFFVSPCLFSGDDELQKTRVMVFDLAEVQFAFRAVGSSCVYILLPCRKVRKLKLFARRLK